MHITLANQWYPPESGWGGVAMWNYAMAHALRDLGHRVTVVAARSSEKVQAKSNVDGISVHRLLVRDRYRLRRLPMLGQYVRPTQQLLYSARLNSTLRDLHARDPFDLVEFADVNAEGFFYAHAPLMPFVVRCHTPTFILKNYYTAREMPYDTAIISRAEKYLIRRASALTAPSRDMARLIVETTGVPANRVAIVANALILDQFQMPNHATTQLPSHLTILFVGRLERAKGVQILVEAIPMVIARVPNARFVFVGDDLTTRGKSQSAELEKQLAEANVLSKVEFVGSVDQETLLEWYRRADICVVPSLLYESFSYTAGQAMAFGKPVVASCIGGIPETVENGVSGILCEPGNVAQWAEAIFRLASDQNLRIALGRAGREKVEHKFDAVKIAQENLRVYERAIGTFKCSNP